jgi:hypothetical protein
MCETYLGIESLGRRGEATERRQRGDREAIERLEAELVILPSYNVSKGREARHIE